MADTNTDPLSTLLTQYLAQSPASSLSPPPSTVPGGGESGYDPLYPIAAVTNNEDEESVGQFVSRFFELSDDPGRNEEWIGSFTEDAVVFMGDKVARGREGQCPTIPYIYAYKFASISNSGLQKSATSARACGRTWSGASTGLSRCFRGSLPLGRTRPR